MKKRTIKNSVKRHELEKCRKMIDEIDVKIVSLLSERIEQAASIGRLKEAAGFPPLDTVRESAVLERVNALAGDKLDKAFIQKLYTEIIEAARSVQMKPKVGFLGPSGTFTHQAAGCFFGRGVSFIPCTCLRDVFSGVEQEEFSFGLVPAENSYEGSIDLTLDLLEGYEVNIVGEQLMPIRHQLLGNGRNLSDVAIIYSHPMALAQCSRRLTELAPHAAQREETSTAAAAGKAALDAGSAAVAASICGEIYGLRILAADVADDTGNTTRFLVLGKGMQKPTGTDKTSIIFSLPHRPGALQSVLTPPAERGINLSRIDSRPVKGRAWEYLFFVDLEGHVEEAPLKKTLEEMLACCTYLRVLGSYPAPGPGGISKQNHPEERNETAVG
jgi:chorismate mutase/prephenate dehydratase